MSLLHPLTSVEKVRDLQALLEQHSVQPDADGFFGVCVSPGEMWTLIQSADWQALSARGVEPGMDGVTIATLGRIRFIVTEVLF